VTTPVASETSSNTDEQQVVDETNAQEAVTENPTQGPVQSAPSNNMSAPSATTTIRLSYAEPTLSWTSSPSPPKSGYLLYWARVGCLAKFGCVTNESELVQKGFKESLDNTASSFSLTNDSSDLMAMVCENVSGSCGVKSNVINTSN
jgi:hypothetical protein